MREVSFFINYLIKLHDYLQNTEFLRNNSIRRINLFSRVQLTEDEILEFSSETLRFEDTTLEF